MRILAHPGLDHPGNPYTHLLYSAIEAQGDRVVTFGRRTWTAGRHDIVHVHWPEAGIFRGGWLGNRRRYVRFLAAIAALRARGSQVVWTIHNLEPHRTLPRQSRIYERMAQLSDGVTSLSGEGLRLARARYPALEGKPAVVVPHGHYRGAYPDEVSRAEARQRLGINRDDAVIASIGRIAAYKGLDDLAAAFHALPQQDLRLLLAGQPADEGLRAELADTTRRDHRILLLPREVPDDQLQVHLRASDLVVLPYRRILHSGSAILALSFDRPVLLPALGAMPELQQEIGEDWVRLYQPPLRPDDLQSAVLWARSRAEAARPDLQRLDWDRLASMTRALYARLLDTAS